MELELKKACFDAYEAAGELTLTQEETAETIVPDYCPDIARIIETTGKVFLHSREMRDGRAEISGTVRVTVLYTPEGEGGIRTLEFAMPFTVETDGRSLPDCAALLADTEPELLETRMLNPRKVFTHCKLVTRLTGYQRRPLCFCTDAEAGPELCIEKKQEQQHAIVLTHIAEKDFTFSEQMDLSPGREGAAEILTSWVNSTVTETKIVGSKLLFKGIFTVSLLYRTADGRCCAASGELPFSQILEVEGAPEGAEPSVRLQFTGADLQVDGADAEGREIAVTLYLHATALLRQTQELTLLSDLYSTAYDLTYDAAPLELTSFREQFTRRQTVPGGAGDRCGGGFHPGPLRHLRSCFRQPGGGGRGPADRGVCPGTVSGRGGRASGGGAEHRRQLPAGAAGGLPGRCPGRLPGRGPGQPDGPGHRGPVPGGLPGGGGPACETGVRVRRKDQYRRA